MAIVGWVAQVLPATAAGPVAQRWRQTLHQIAWALGDALSGWTETVGGVCQRGVCQRGVCQRDEVQRSYEITPAQAKDGRKYR
ncbi:MAG: hypothetical protein Fur0046_08390 [Cyanobacteria bacterium J069]